MVKLFLLSLAFVFCLAKADVSHLANNGYLPPEQPESIAHEVPTYTSKEVNFNVHRPLSAPSTPIQQTQKEYQPRHPQIESIQPSIHIASFSVRTTVPFPQTYSQQQAVSSQRPTQSTETKPNLSYSYNPQAHFPQAPVYQPHSPPSYTPQEYAPSAPVSQKHVHPRPVEIPTVTSTPEHQYFTSPTSINQDPQPLQPNQQSYGNYGADHHPLVPSSLDHQNYLPPTQSAYTPLLSYQQSYSPESSSHSIYSPPSPASQAPSQLSSSQTFYSPPVLQQQDYSPPAPVQQSSFAPELDRRLFSTPPPPTHPATQPSYQHSQISESSQYSAPSYPHPQTEHNTLRPAQPQQNYIPPTNEYHRTSEIYSTSNNVQQSHEHRSTIQHPTQQYTPSTNTQVTSEKSQPTYKPNSSAYSPPPLSEVPTSTQQFNSPSTYNYQAPGSTLQQQIYSPPTPERIQQNYLPPAPVKQMNTVHPVYPSPSHPQQQIVKVDEEPHKQITPATQPKPPKEPVYHAPTASREAYSSVPMHPQKIANSPLPGPYNDNAAQVPLSEPSKIVSSHNPIYEPPVPSQLAFSYEVSSSSPGVHPYSYNAPSKHIQTPTHLTTVETQHSQDSPRQSPISVVGSYSYTAPTEHKYQNSIHDTQIHNSASQTLQERPEYSSQAYNKPQQDETPGSYLYKTEHSAMAAHPHDALTPRNKFNFFPEPVPQSQGDYSYNAPVTSARNVEIKSTDAMADPKETTKLSVVQPIQQTGPSLISEAMRSGPSNSTEYGSNGGYIYRRQ